MPARSRGARMTDIDWKTELRKYEREFVGLPPEPSPAELRERRLAEERERQRHDEINDRAGAWLRLLLVLTLSAALSAWPYARGCGAGLYGFLGAEGAVMAGGLWVAIHSWRRRVASAHAIGFVVLLGGAAMAGLEVLPRVGYARPDPTRPSQWACTVR
jgi:hypothetical protein